MNTFDSLKPTPEIVIGIMKAGSVAMFVGSSKSYKTWHLVRLGLCISQGKPWFGHPTKKSKVLMVNPELIANEFQIRIRDLANNMNIPLKDIEGNFSSLSLRRKKLNPEALVDNIKNLVIAGKFEVVILDSLYRLYGDRTDENSNSDMMKLMIKLEEICALDGVTVIFSHHTAKGSQDGKRTIDVAGGAGALGRFVDTAIVTRALEDHDQVIPGEHRYSLEVIYRYGKAPETIGLIMNGPMARIDPNFNKAELETNNKYNNGTILNILAEKPMTYGELLAKAKTQTSISEATFKRYWKFVKKTPGVTEDADRKWTYVKPITV